MHTEIKARLEHAPSAYLRRFYYDGVVYHRSALQSIIDLVGVDRIMFGTDNPFFPPEEGPRSEVLWPSTVKNYDILEQESEEYDMIVRGNASRLLNIPMK